MNKNERKYEEEEEEEEKKESVYLQNHANPPTK